LVYNKARPCIYSAMTANKQRNSARAGRTCYALQPIQESGWQVAIPVAPLHIDARKKFAGGALAASNGTVQCSVVSAEIRRFSGKEQGIPNWRC